MGHRVLGGGIISNSKVQAVPLFFIPQLRPDMDGLHTAWPSGLPVETGLHLPDAVRMWRSGQRTAK